MLWKSQSGAQKYAYKMQTSMIWKFLQPEKRYHIYIHSRTTFQQKKPSINTLLEKMSDTKQREKWDTVYDSNALR